MENFIRFCLLGVLLFLLPCIGATESWLYESGGSSTFAAVLCHGKGGDPESHVVDPLRPELNEQLGFHTVSLRMPGGVKTVWDYDQDFLAASQEINRAVLFLQEKDVRRIVLIAHSLGSRMATTYLASSPSPLVQSFIGVGIGHVE